MRVRVTNRALLGFLAVVSGCVPKHAAGPAESAPGAVPSAPPPGGNLLKNAEFSGGVSLPWTTSFSSPASGAAHLENGALCLTIDNMGVNTWDAQLRHREMVIEQGHTYQVSYRIWADKATSGRVKVGMAGPPYAEYWHQDFELTTEPQTLTGEFKMWVKSDSTAEFAFHLGGLTPDEVQTPVKVCIDDLYLSDPEFTPGPVEAARPLPKIRVNQLGYLTGRKKAATLVSASSEPVEWKLLQKGTEVAQGKTVPFGADKDSGDTVHLIDLSGVTSEGDGFQLAADGGESAQFSLGRSIYSALKYDALKYFYHTRSGVPIEEKYVGQAKWARPAGHEVSDKSVPCAPDAGCKYKLDVSGGWYDAGDYGKYVVNGGISVWTLQNQYERAVLGKTAAPFEDGKLNIPESGNRFPDLLDEARFEIEFILKMMVPDGEPLAGMVHHKIHDVEWTALGIRADVSAAKFPRALRPVSTAATLNAAAVLAQAARLWKALDPAFSAACLAGAEKAYKAALAHPNLLITAADTVGGGPYDDADVSDEFFWAAAELFVTTRSAAYKDALTKSPYWTAGKAKNTKGPTAITWQETEFLGKMSLALVPSGLSAAELQARRAELISQAEHYLEVEKRQGYGVPNEPDAEGKFAWGSNSHVLNNMIILGYAHDFTRDARFLDGVAQGMDYILGRNPLSQSYVTGYGANPLRHPHHRFWAQQVDPAFPEAPPGIVSGGPNSSLQDPYAQAAGLPGCAPQKCFVDHIEAYSVNEITINWNAPLAWGAAYLDEQANPVPAVAPKK